MRRPRRAAAWLLAGIAVAPGAAGAVPRVQAGGAAQVDVDSNLEGGDGDSPEVRVRGGGWVAAATFPALGIRLDGRIGGEAQWLVLRRRAAGAGAMRVGMTLRPAARVSVGLWGGLDAWTGIGGEEAVEWPRTLGPGLRGLVRGEVEVGAPSAPRLEVSGTARMGWMAGGVTSVREVLGTLGLGVPVGGGRIAPVYALELADTGVAPLSFVAHLLGVELVSPSAGGWGGWARLRGGMEGDPGNGLGPVLRAEGEVRRRVGRRLQAGLGGGAYVAAPVNETPGFRSFYGYLSLGVESPSAVVGRPARRAR
ncbi:hypothetical protein L6R50_02625 [Myxococcota bacterium]|nr:hypothetical protein [Myxococcota bacterium]